MRKTYALLAGLAGAMSAVNAASAAVVYRQNFSASAGMTSLSAVGWTASYGNAATNATTAVPGNTGVPANAMLSAGPSAPTDGANLNATAVAGATAGFVPLLSADGAQQLLAYTGEYAVDPAATPTFAWYLGSAFAGDTQRLAVRVGDQWFASTVVFSPAAGAVTGTQFQTIASQASVTYSTAAGAWQTLNFAANTPLTPGTTAALPAGAITAFGVYATLADAAGSTAEKTYIDSFTVSTPEPAIGLTGLAAAGLVLRRRRNGRGV